MCLPGGERTFGKNECACELRPEGRQSGSGYYGKRLHDPVISVKVSNIKGKEAG
jgi:hypothetical protein